MIIIFIHDLSKFTSIYKKLYTFIALDGRQENKQRKSCALLAAHLGKLHTVNSVGRPTARRTDDLRTKSRVVKNG